MIQMILRRFSSRASILLLLTFLTCAVVEIGHTARFREDFNGRMQVPAALTNSNAPALNSVLAIFDHSQPKANNSASTFMVEAESGVLSLPMTIVPDAKAFGNLYVTSMLANLGSVTFTVNIETAGDYIFWGRVIGPTPGQDSFFVSVDDGAEDVYDVAENTWSTEWQWTKVNGRAGGGALTLNPRIFTLSQGEHTIVFRTREANTALDCLVITNDPDFVPDDKLPIPTPSPTPPPPQIMVTGFELHDAKDNVYPLFRVTQLTLGSILEPLVIHALTEPDTVGSVRMKLGTIDDHADNEAPYTTDPFYLNRLGEGTHEVSATPYSEPDLRGAQGRGLTIVIEVVGSTPTPTPTPSQTIIVSPTVVNFMAVAGGVSPPAQSIQVTTSNGAPWSSFDASLWFNAVPSSGPSGAVTNLIPNIVGLVAGTYTQNITFSSPGLPDKVVAVNLTATSPNPTPTPTPTPDTTPPVINGVSSFGVTSSAASVSWTTDEASDTQVEYGTTTSYGGSSALNTSMVTSHSASLSELSASTLYHYRVKSRDVAGNLATSGDFTFTTSAPASSPSYYVATTGSDSNPGSLTQPFRTLGKGVSVLSPGATLFVRDGTYIASTQIGNIPNGTSWAQPVTIKAYPGETPVIAALSGSGEQALSFDYADQYIVFDGFVIDATGGINGVKIRNGSHHIRIMNCEVKNAPFSGIQVTDEPGAGYNEFINLDVHNNGSRARYDHGIYISAPNNLVEGGRYHNNAAYGIQLDQGSSDNNTIRYSRVYDNSAVGEGGGIVVADGENNLVAYNLIYNNGGLGGIYVSYGAADTRVYNNTCVDDAYFYRGTGGEITNNIVTGTLRLEETVNLVVSTNLTSASILQVNNSGTTFSSNLIGSPQFVDEAANDYHLLVTSPAINAGTSVGLTRDFDGNPIVGAPDIGAHEFG